MVTLLLAIGTMMVTTTVNVITTLQERIVRNVDHCSTTDHGDGLLDETRILAEVCQLTNISCFCQLLKPLTTFIGGKLKTASSKAVLR